MTPLLDWSDDFSVGIEEIDEQHKVLIGLLNELDMAIRQRRGSEITDSILKRLEDYTRVHFTLEEALMRVLDYPDYEAHKHEHERLIADLQALKKKYAADHSSISFELVHFMKNWLMTHTLGTDRKYAAYFMQKGVKEKLSTHAWASDFLDIFKKN